MIIVETSVLANIFSNYLLNIANLYPNLLLIMKNRQLLIHNRKPIDQVCGTPFVFCSIAFNDEVKHLYYVTPIKFQVEISDSLLY